ncbi:hypothetical protein NXS98_13610 [Fontisphaera persica]|uniref:hypothetical protein n=1 Tax=Fontisphaera persica TaxID=2974023 RepID=UPI0024BF9970|nr:hypothetical protein [Fontisphaera persica]WCJ58746.1 hypothetical protein NXS98_13610 [Fontisphaera persica]
MKAMMQNWRRIVTSLLLGGFVLALCGCGSVEKDATHVSSRPWNAPKSWEGGLPTSLNEGR